MVASGGFRQWIDNAGAGVAYYLSPCAHLFTQGGVAATFYGP